MQSLRRYRQFQARGDADGKKLASTSDPILEMSTDQRGATRVLYPK